jgi:hypothetical protein
VPDNSHKLTRPDLQIDPFESLPIKALSINIPVLQVVYPYYFIHSTSQLFSARSKEHIPGTALPACLCLLMPIIEIILGITKTGKPRLKHITV